MTALRLVGLDLSTTSTGIAWTHDRHGTPSIGCKTVETPSPMALPKRIHRVLEDVEVAVRCRPHLVVLEGTFSRLSSSDVPLHELRGVILFWLWNRRPKIRYFADVSPSTLKVWSAGNGNAPKKTKNDEPDRPGVLDQMIAAYGRSVTIRTTDEADALALVSFAAAAYGEPIAPIPDYARRAFRLPKAPRWPDLATEAGPVVPVTGGAR